jgi:glyoxylase-like metal-dependent hydrolase (beta-lactamase superfamily II)
MSGSLPPGVRVIRAHNPSPMTLDGTRTFLVGEREVAVIDPGPDDPTHQAAIVAALHRTRPVAVLLTHGHRDHAAGAAALAVRLGAPIRAAPDGGVGTAGAASVHPLRDGDRVMTDAGGLLALATPGHSGDHFAFLLERRDRPAGPIVFVGDLMMGSGDTTLVAAPEGDLEQYLHSLKRVAAARPSLILPAHGDPIADPAESLERYRRHRRERVEQVRVALARGLPARPAALLEAVYGPALPAALRGAAEGSVAAILKYLEVPRER